MSKPFLPLALSEVNPKTRQLLNEIDRRFSSLPNFFATLARSEPALFATAGFHAALSEGAVTPLEREAIILAVSFRNQCHYCVSAHAAFARQLGAEPGEIALFARARAPEPQLEAMLKIACAACEPDRQSRMPAVIEAGRAAGLSDEQIIDAIAWSAFTQYLNQMADALGIVIDYPAPSEYAIAMADEAA